jgi:hypothetical protein
LLKLWLSPSSQIPQFVETVTEELLRMMGTDAVDLTFLWAIRSECSPEQWASLGRRAGPRAPVDPMLTLAGSLLYACAQAILRFRSCGSTTGAISS